MAMALSVAIDLSLNKLIVPPPGFPQREIPDHIPKSECITAKKALLLDGFEDVDPYSSWGQRLLRRRERIWLSLFVLDRGYDCFEMKLHELTTVVESAWQEEGTSLCT
jgi:hypothetical protein